MEEQGFILIADITGYTSYLNRSELDHARGTLSDLLELLIDHTRPPLVVSQLEGDAVMSYGLRVGFLSSQSFMETVEDTYVAFRRAIQLMVLNNTCRCNACANVSSLDLKFFVHYGTFTFQELDDRQQILGSDVNLIHRLLKNSVTETTGVRAYLLCTSAALNVLDLDNSLDGLIRHTEEVEDFGQVELWVKDMHPVFEARRGEHEIIFEEDEIVDYVETEIRMPPELVWDYVNQSAFRDILIGSDRHDVVGRKNDGRIGRGSTYQCYHGKRTIPQVVVEWRPFERVVFQMLTPVPGRETHALFDFELTPTPTGTRLSSTIGRVTGPILQRTLVRTMLRARHRTTQHEMDTFREEIERDHARNEPLLAPVHPIPLDSIGAAAAQALQQVDADARSEDGSSPQHPDR